MTTATSIMIQARADIGSMCNSNGPQVHVYRRLAELSGVSASMIAKFHKGVRKQIGVANLDAVVSAIAAAKRIDTK